jgi:hypothetical protein
MESDEEEDETETDKETVETTEEQKKRRELIHTYLTSMMEKEENKQEEPSRTRELLHAYSKFTMDNEDKQMEQDGTETYLRTSTEKELNYSMEEEYNKDKPCEEHHGKKEWMTQSSCLTEKEENTLFIAFMTGNVENQKT